MVHKAHHKSNGARIVEVRSLKKFSTDNFLRDLELRQWSNVYCFEELNEMWATWKSMLMESIDKHVPCRSRCIAKKRSSWITNDLKRQMFKRDYFKTKAVSSEDPRAWHKYRQSRNHMLMMKLNDDNWTILISNLALIKSLLVLCMSDY